MSSSLIINTVVSHVYMDSLWSFRHVREAALIAFSYCRIVNITQCHNITSQASLLTYSPVQSFTPNVQFDEIIKYYFCLFVVFSLRRAMALIIVFHVVFFCFVFILCLKLQINVFPESKQKNVEKKNYRYLPIFHSSREFITEFVIPKRNCAVIEQGRNKRSSLFTFNTLAEFRWTIEKIDPNDLYLWFRSRFLKGWNQVFFSSEYVSCSIRM